MFFVRSLVISQLRFLRSLKLSYLFFVQSLVVSQLGVKLLMIVFGLSLLHIPFRCKSSYLCIFIGNDLLTLRKLIAKLVKLLMQIVYHLGFVLLITLAPIAKHKAYYRHCNGHYSYNDIYFHIIIVIFSLQNSSKYLIYTS